MPPELNSDLNSTQDVNANAVDSSTAANLPNTTDVNATESSTVEKTDVKTLSLFETVKASIAESKADEQKDGATSSAEGVEAKSETEATEGDAEVDSDEELLKSLDPKSKATARIRELVSENKSLSSEAESFKQLSNWTKESGLNQTEFITGLEVMRNMKQDPFKALEMIMPYVESLQRATGQILPDDIQEKIDTGIIDEETAAELVQSRKRAEFLQNREIQNQQATEQNNRQTQEQAHYKSILDSVTAWDKQWKSTDPDYSKKSAMVERTVTYILANEGYPADPKAAVEISKRARDMVEKELSGILPKRTTIQTVKSGSQTPTDVTPKNSFEAAKAALAGVTVSY